MNRNLPLLALLATVLLVGILFFRVVEPFLFPVFFAAVLALLFAPLQDKTVRLLRGHRQIAAGLLTVLILGAGLVPLATGLYFAGEEAVSVAHDLVESQKNGKDDVKPLVRRITEYARQYLDEDQVTELRRSVFSGLRDASVLAFDRTQALISNMIGFVVGLIIMILSLYYFLADGRTILKNLQSISPFQNDDEAELFHEFEAITRGVILASILSALIQAVLAGIGFAVAGVDKYWLLAGLTMLSAMIPFLGAGFIWASTAIALAVEGEHATAIGLAVYGLLIVSMSDNLLRAYIIHGTSGLHPLVGLISILGALQIVGLWGIFIGPTIAAFFYALLKILHRKIEAGSSGREPASNCSN